MLTFRRFSAFALILGGTLFAQEPTEIPKTIEAESAQVGEVKPDAQASGGKYVTGEAGGTLFRCPVPTDGGQFTVWLRFRGCQLVLGSIAEGTGEKELAKIEKAPTKWTWISAGTFDHERLGRQIVVVRGVGGGVDAGLDAVILAPTPDFDPNHPHQNKAATP